MARFTNVGAALDGNDLRVRFQLDAPGVIGWQIYDPTSGAFLFEGQWTELRDANVDLLVSLPLEDGPYRVQVAPVADRERFILIDTELRGGRAAMSPPKVTTSAALRRQRFLQSGPKAFVYPVRMLWQNRKLIGSMVRRDILARSRGSLGGGLWTILNPLLLMATYAFVFGVALKTRFGGDNSGVGYVLYFLAGMLPWLAFSEAVGRSPYVILEHRNFVKKLVFPLETLPANLVLSGVVTEAFALIIFICGLLIARGGIPITAVWLPALIIPQLLFTAGLCWFLAALGIFVRDLGQVVGFLLTLWFFLTPICYSEANLGPRSVKFLSANPIWLLVRGYRTVLLEHKNPDFIALTGLWVVSIALAVAGYGWFHRLRKSFADVI